MGSLFFIFRGDHKGRPNFLLIIHSQNENHWKRVRSTLVVDLIMAARS
jgi:hypothetical protein